MPETNRSQVGDGRRPVIMKFGGTSVEDGPAFLRVARIVESQRDMRPVVVVSAMRGVTDALVHCVELAAANKTRLALDSIDAHLDRHRAIAGEVLSEPCEIATIIDRSRGELLDMFEAIVRGRVALKVVSDAVLSYGERLAATLLAFILHERGFPARYVDARRCIVTDANHGCAHPHTDRTELATRREVIPLIQRGQIPVLGGFIAASTDGATTTLGRGGSDYSAALIGVALGAREIQIWTDVCGVLTADPRVVPHAKTIDQLSYEEIAELSFFGAKVIHPKTIYPAIECRIPVRILNSSDPHGASTLVTKDVTPSRGDTRAIAHKTGDVLVEISAPDSIMTNGHLSSVFDAAGHQHVTIDAASVSKNAIVIAAQDDDGLSRFIDDVSSRNETRVRRGFAIVSVVGEGLRECAGITARILGAIREIDVTMISLSASGRTLSIVIDERDVHKAVNRIHDDLFGPRTESRALMLEREQSSRTAFSADLRR